MRRRAFLTGAGAATVLSATGGSWYAYDRGVFSVGEGPAYEPWKDWRGGGSEGPLALIRTAILAASPHNTQPWLFRVEHGRVHLMADTARQLTAQDPEGRAMLMSCGAALLNLEIEAPDEL